MQKKIFAVLCTCLLAHGLYGMQQERVFKDLVTRPLPDATSWWQRTKQWFVGLPVTITHEDKKQTAWDTEIIGNDAKKRNLYEQKQNKALQTDPRAWVHNVNYLALQLKSLSAIAKQCQPYIFTRLLHNGLLSAGITALGCLGYQRSFTTGGFVATALAGGIAGWLTLLHMGKPLRNHVYYLQDKFCINSKKQNNYLTDQLAELETQPELYDTTLARCVLNHITKQASEHRQSNEERQA